ncbi:M20/M25/M40 family metallo-hydrolase [Konateibacter massiliensis]|uniref:M20/M25/M40 family metallo-hydrolase n=1 Tax=Konateibacter massiliensis TaxID=2002841 RepID=UPI000C150127|nr:M20/M25/M40 family metallo-hydrolase [Konateibacter massiliensis]
MSEKINDYQVNIERLTEQFKKLVSIDSVSFQEREMADYLREQFEQLGFEVMEDEAGKHYQSDTGNLFAFKKGNIEGAPILFSSHMDTVMPGFHKKAIIQEDGTITSDGTTVLGADDVSGIAAILEAVRILEENNARHRDIEVFLPIAEEVYLKGSEVFDPSIIKAKEAYVLDLCGPIGTAALQAPTLIAFTLEVIGKASHAGFAPEEGINAIRAAAQVIGQVNQGQVDSETTVNLGTIEGGTATNIVSDYCKIRGEIRSYRHEKAKEQLNEIEQIAAKVTKEMGASYRLEKRIECYAYETDKESLVVRRYQKACEELEIPVTLTKTFGGSDNNNLVKYGMNGIVIACGMEQVHSCKEYTTVDALVKSTNVIRKLMESEE